MTMDPIAAYTGKAKNYAAFRLPYSHKTIEGISVVCGLDHSWSVADIGAGTGILTELIVDHAGHIYALEPNEDMRREAQRLLKGKGKVEYLSGTAEQTNLPTGSIDLITVGQALHWFDPVSTRREFSRILKPEGWLAVVWNQFKGGKDPNITIFFSPRSIQRMSVAMRIQETWEQFMGGMRSAAAAPSIDDPVYPDFEKSQRQLFERRARDGLITIAYGTEIVVGKLSR